MKFKLSYKRGAYYVNIPNFDGGECVTIDELQAAEARAAQLQAEHDALAAELATVTAERDALQSDIDMLRNELDKHEPIEWPGLTGFTP